MEDKAYIQSVGQRIRPKDILFNKRCDELASSIILDKLLDLFKPYYLSSLLMHFPQGNHSTILDKFKDYIPSLL